MPIIFMEQDFFTNLKNGSQMQCTKSCLKNPIEMRISALFLGEESICAPSRAMDFKVQPDFLALWKSLESCTWETCEVGPDNSHMNRESNVNVAVTSNAEGRDSELSLKSQPRNP